MSMARVRSRLGDFMALGKPVEASDIGSLFTLPVHLEPPRGSRLNLELVNVTGAVDHIENSILAPWPVLKLSKTFVFVAQSSRRFFC